MRRSVAGCAFLLLALAAQAFPQTPLQYLWIDPDAVGACGKAESPGMADPGCGLATEPAAAPARPKRALQNGAFAFGGFSETQEKAPVTRLTTLAGKFMGRVDAATLGRLRVRFEVILK